MLFFTRITYTSGDTHKGGPFTADKIDSTVRRLCNSADKGIIKRAIIIDSSDCVMVEIKGRNITFPPELVAQQAAFRKAQKNKK